MDVYHVVPTGLITFSIFYCDILFSGFQMLWMYIFTSTCCMVIIADDYSPSLCNVSI